MSTCGAFLSPLAVDPAVERKTTKQNKTFFARCNVHTYAHRRVQYNMFLHRIRSFLFQLFIPRRYMIIITRTTQIEKDDNGKGLKTHV